MSSQEEQLSNHDWLMREIIGAKSMERLDYLADAIKYDTWEKTEYTQDEEGMAQIRAAWGKRRDELNSH